MRINLLLDIGGCGGIGGGPYSQSFEEKKNISSLENAFSKEDFGAILENVELFWLAFCKAFNEVKYKDQCFKHRDAFFTDQKGDILTISGIDHIISQLKEFIEEFRILFVKGHIQRGGFTLLVIKICNDFYIKEQTDVIDLSDWLEGNHVNLYESWFDSFIRPVMPGLIKSLGAICTEETLSQKIITHRLCKDDVLAYKIDWKNGDNFAYPIKVNFNDIKQKRKKRRFNSH